MNGCSASTTHQWRGDAALSSDDKQRASALAKRIRTSARLSWGLFWLCAVLALAAIGYRIADVLESGLLGFLGADFVFLIAVSLYTAGHGTSREGR